ncbi:hypothetical protein OQA88_1827 [Cercophora sp. LCS_1]
MADANATTMPPPPPPGTGPAPLGVPGGADRSYSVDIMVCAVFTAVIGSVFVGLRFYTRRILINVLGLEDWLMLAAQVFSIAMSAGFIHQATLGHGSHVWTIPMENFSPMAKVILSHLTPHTHMLTEMQAGWYSIFFYGMSLYCSQVSIMLLYVRIWNFPWVRRAAYILLAGVLIYNTLVMVMVLTACVPLRAWWDFELQFDPDKPAYCHKKGVFWANTYLHIIFDFLVYLLPMPVIFQVRFPTRQKVLLFVLFAFGFFVCALSIIRLYLLQITAATMDFTYDNVSIAFWSCIETNATVVVGCFATMKPLLSKWFPNLTEGRKPREGEQGAGSPQGQIHVSGRVPTIGSTPLRQHGQGPHRWTQLERSRDDEKKDDVVEISLEGSTEKGESSQGSRS